jgi:hypothetical protein
MGKGNFSIKKLKSLPKQTIFIIRVQKKDIQPLIKIKKKVLDLIMKINSKITSKALKIKYAPLKNKPAQ